MRGPIQTDTERTVAFLEQLQLVVVCVEHLRKDNKRMNNKKELQNIFTIGMNTMKMVPSVFMSINL